VLSAVQGFGLAGKDNRTRHRQSLVEFLPGREWWIYETVGKLKCPSRHPRAAGWGRSIIGFIMTAVCQKRSDVHVSKQSLDNF
jgi:hypothetical protein